MARITVNIKNRDEAKDLFHDLDWYEGEISPGCFKFTNLTHLEFEFLIELAQEMNLTLIESRTENNFQPHLWLRDTEMAVRRNQPNKIKRLMELDSMNQYVWPMKPFRMRVQRSELMSKIKTQFFQTTTK